MRQGDFHRRALLEAERYGADDWVFLRELAQNARDARARHIDVRTGVEGAHEWLSFDDDGEGMSFAHAREFLFRLYASSKEDDPEAAGRFGVGFWSVLRFRPTSITVESRTATEAWAVELEGGLRAARRSDCEKTTRGTRVSMTRPRSEGADGFAREAAQALRRYCRYLRTMGSKAVPLLTTCNGVAINEELSVSGPIALRFSCRDAEGFVGLGERPRVELYARGLLVSSVTVLEELLTGDVRPRHEPEHGRLAPVVLLNSNRLDVVVSRQAPMDSRALRRLARLAGARVRRVIDLVMARTDLAPRRARWAWIVRPTGRVTVGLMGLTALAGVVAAVLRLTAGWEVRPTASSTAVHATSAPPLPASASHPAIIGPGAVESARASSSRPPEPSTRTYEGVTSYAGATVDVLDGTAAPWALVYTGAGDLLFRALALDRYDPTRGWVRAEAGPLRAHPRYRCRRGCVRVRLQVRPSGEPLVLPIPSTHRVDPESIRFAGVAVDELYTNDLGEALLVLPAGHTGELEYVTGPARSWPQPALYVPPVVLPPWLDKQLAVLSALPLRERVRATAAFVRDRIAYDVSHGVARAYAERGGSWLERVLAIGAGDCDVKNGLNVLLLRRLGIPARLVVGIAGQNGRARPYLHAWTEYYWNGWHVVDATGTAPAALIEPERPDRDVPIPVVALPMPSPPRLGTITAPRLASLASGTTSALRRSRFVATELPRVGLLVGLLALGCGAGLLLVWSWWRWPREEVVARGGALEARETLVLMMRDALLHPRAWSRVRTLWQRRVLPTLAGSRLSLTQALRRSSRGELFVSRGHTALARAALHRGHPVLDGGDSAFAPVTALLGAILDLDALDALKPATPGDGSDAVALEAALHDVNRVLARAAGGIECHVCPALVDAPTYDVDLAALRLGRRQPWPRRFVAINPRSPEVVAHARALLTDASRGTFFWLDWLLDRSALLAEYAVRVREEAAWGYIERAE